MPFSERINEPIMGARGIGLDIASSACCRCLITLCASGRGLMFSADSDAVIIKGTYREGLEGPSQCTCQVEAFVGACKYFELYMLIQIHPQPRKASRTRTAESMEERRPRQTETRCSTLESQSPATFISNRTAWLVFASASRKFPLFISRDLTKMRGAIAWTL